MGKLNLSPRNLNKSNSDSPQPLVERLDQIGITDKRRPSSFDKKSCPKGDSARAKRAPIWEFKIPVSVLREGKRYVAYTPALDLSTSGKSYEEVKKRFNEIVNIFFEELTKKGVLEEVLSDLGWKRVQARWNPPVVVSQESQAVKVPL